MNKINIIKTSIILLFTLLLVNIVSAYEEGNCCSDSDIDPLKGVCYTKNNECCNNDYTKILKCEYDQSSNCQDGLVWKKVKDCEALEECIVYGSEGLKCTTSCLKLGGFCQNGVVLDLDVQNETCSYTGIGVSPNIVERYGPCDRQGGLGNDFCQVVYSQYYFCIKCEDGFEKHQVACCKPENEDCGSRVYENGELISWWGGTGTGQFKYIPCQTTLCCGKEGTNVGEYGCCGSGLEKDANNKCISTAEPEKQKPQELKTIYPLMKIFYDPNLGRYITPFPYVNSLIFQNLNPYTYLLNNPYTSNKEEFYNNIQIINEYYPDGKLKSTTHPNTGTTTFTYYPDGKLQTKKDANGKTITYIYESDKIKTIDYPISIDTNYEYESNSLKKVTDSSGTISFTYYPDGKVKKKTQTINTEQYTIEYTYEGNNIKTTIITTPKSTKTLTYNQDSVSVGNIIIKPLNYIIEESNKDLIFDTLKRLTKAYNNFLWKNLEYTYDNQGNRESHKGDKPIQYKYYKELDVDGGNRFNSNNIVNPSSQHTNRLGNSDDKYYEYDANGNLIKKYDNKGEIETFGYDEENRLISYKSNTKDFTYVYNYKEERIKKIDNKNNKTTIYLYDEQGRLIYEYTK